MRKWLIPLVGLAAALAATGAVYALADDGSGTPDPKDSDLPTFSAMCAEEMPDCNDTLLIDQDDEGGSESFDEWAYLSDPEVDPLELELGFGELQEPVGELGAELAAKERDTFAGLWIEWTPKFHVVVRFTRDGEETIQPYLENAPFVDAVEVRAARATLAELQNAHAAANRAVSDLGIAFNSGTNVKENRVELYVTDPKALDAALQRANMQLPDYIEMVKFDVLASPADGF